MWNVNPGIWNLFLWNFQTHLLIPRLIRQVGDDKLEHFIRSLHTAVTVSYLSGWAKRVIQVVLSIVIHALGYYGAALRYLHHLFKGVKILPVEVPFRYPYQPDGITAWL